MKFTIIAVSVPALRQCTSENVPDAADGTDDGKYSALWNHQGYEKCVSADGLIAAVNQDGYGIFYASDSQAVWRPEISSKRKAVYHGIRNLSERSFFSGNLR